MSKYDRWMQRAYEEASLSPDPSTQTSAVLIDATEEFFVSSGHNHFPKGVSDAHWHGPKDGKYARVVHAEVAALLDAARIGISTVDATMVAPWAACANCAKHIADAGIAVLVRHRFIDNGVTEDSPWYEDCLLGDEIMTESGVYILEIPPVATNIRLRRNGSLWPAEEA